MNWIGVDYGSKVAGTTAACFLEGERLTILQTEKKEDADKWLRALVEKLKPSHVLIDAPLSLPGGFFGKNSEYFYRQCDKETRAMSPMFLGGLTARAIKLKDCTNRINFVETYPSYLIKRILGWEECYRKKEKIGKEAIERFERILPYSFIQPPTNWHQFDAVACWFSGWRLHQGEALFIGEVSEGIITI